MAGTVDPQEPPRRLNLGFWAAIALGVGVAVAAALPLMTPGMVGFLNDDGYYVTTARALAAGVGYVHPFAPDPEPAYRYPIFYPAVLALFTGWISGLTSQLVAMQGLSVVCLVLLVVATGVLLARLGLRPWAAAAIAGLVGLHPHVLRLSTQVMSDVPFAALSMGALLALGQTREDAPRRRVWLAIAGLLMGAMVLMRYQGATLAMAAVLAFLLARRFKDAVWTAFFVGAPLLPWALWVLTVSGPWYQGVFRQIAGTYSDTNVLLASSAKFVLLAALPSGLLPFLAPPASGDPLLQQLPAWLALLGALVALAMLLGAARAAARPANWLERVAALYFLLTLALVIYWNTAFVFLGFQQAVRLVIPILPLALYFGVKSLGPRWIGAALSLGLVAAVGTTWQFREARLLPADRAEGYQRVFQHLRAATPPGAVIGSTMPPMVYLYTDRRGAPFSLQSPEQFAASVQAGRLDYVFLNRRLYGYLGTGEDVLSVFLQQVEDRYPGLLAPQYRDPEAGMEVWTVRRAAIAGERPDHRRLGDGL